VTQPHAVVYSLSILESRLCWLEEKRAVFLFKDYTLRLNMNSWRWDVDGVGVFIMNVCLLG